MNNIIIHNIFLYDGGLVQIDYSCKTCSPNVIRYKHFQNNLTKDEKADSLLLKIDLSKIKLNCDC